MRVFPLFLLLMSFNLQAELCHSDFKEPCSLLIEKVLPSGKSYKLEISEAHLAIKHPGQIEGTGYWGANGRFPATHVNKLSLRIDGESVRVPLKVYSDLGNLTFAEVKENEAAIVLVVKGGDAASAYYATYVFYDKQLRKRTVRSSEQPGQVWEKTSFSEPIETQTQGI